MRIIATVVMTLHFALTNLYYKTQISLGILDFCNRDNLSQSLLMKPMHYRTTLLLYCCVRNIFWNSCVSSLDLYQPVPLQESWESCAAPCSCSETLRVCSWTLSSSLSTGSRAKHASQRLIRTEWSSATSFIRVSSTTTSVTTITN